MNTDIVCKGIWRACRSIMELHRSLRPTPHPRLIMTLLVKDEEELLEHNLQFHHAMGVDGFIITDNNSSDATPSIIEKYRRKGWVLECIRETSSGYEQKRWVDRMVMLAKMRYGADWVINADADEFWWTPLGSLKEEMVRAKGNVLTTEMRVVYPHEERPWTSWEETVRAIPPAERDMIGLSRHTIFAPNRPKVAHRTDGYIHIAMGNHKVAMLPRRRCKSGILIYHYMWHGHDHFLRKVVNGGKELEKHSSRHGGRHWRELYAIYKSGRIEEEYQRIFAPNRIEWLRNQGYLIADCPIPAFRFEA